jgi:hypothetical protein
MLLLLALPLLCGQCKSTNDPDPVPPTPPTPPVVTKTKTELLIGKNWKLTAATINPAYDFFGQQRLINNIYGNMPFCKTANLYRYEQPDIFTISTTCPTGGPYTGPFKWTLSNNETTLTWVFSPYSVDEVYTIETLTEDDLVLVQNLVKMGTSYTTRFTYTKR